MADNSTRPLVSFIITFYNEPTSMLRECIESVHMLSLSAQEREIILINDGADNDCLLALSDIKDSIIYIRQANRGLSEARNLGMRVATGKYIQFIDADDYLLRVQYEHCLDLVRYHNPDVVLFDFTDKKECEHSDRVPSFLPKPQTGAEYMRQNNLKAPAWGYVFRKSVAATLTFRPGILHEDEEFTPQLILRCELVFDTHVKSYFYRKRSNSITHAADTANSQKRLNDKESIIDRLYALKDTLPPIDQPSLQRRIDQMVLDYLYDTVIDTHSVAQLNERVARLESKGLFPPSDKKYTKKYTAFRKLMTSKVGRRLFVAATLLSKR